MSNHILRAVFVALFFTASAVAVFAQPSASRAEPRAEVPGSYAHLATALAEIVREAIPPTYERDKDWGRQKRITTGLRIDKLDISRRKKEVDHGTWKRYHIELVDPEENLQVRVENLRSLGPGKAALTIVVDGKFKGWAQARVYNRGVHVITLTTEGMTTLTVRADFEMSITATPADFFAGIQLSPVATSAHVDIRDFELNRVGELHGSLARELGSGLKRVIQKELDGPKLVTKLNRAIDKKRDRLKVSPDALLPVK